MCECKGTTAGTFLGAAYRLQLRSAKAFGSLPICRHDLPYINS